MISQLDRLLTRLIAEQRRVPEAVITCEWIEEQRKKRVYPTARYHEPGLTCLTGEEWEKLEKSADEYLEKLGREEVKRWRR